MNGPHATTHSEHDWVLTLQMHLTLLTSCHLLKYSFLLISDTFPPTSLITCFHISLQVYSFWLWNRKASQDLAFFSFHSEDWLSHSHGFENNLCDLICMFYLWSVLVLWVPDQHKQIPALHLFCDPLKSLPNQCLYPNSWSLPMSTSKLHLSVPLSESQALRVTLNFSHQHQSL